MNHFPPPSPTEHRTLVADDAPATPSRRRGGTIAALTAGVLIGGLVAGTQFASASTPPADDAAPPIDDDSAWQSWDECFTQQLGLDTSGEEPDTFEATDEQLDAADDACIDLLPEEFHIDTDAWDAHGACIDEHLGDLGGPNVMFGTESDNGSVSVDLPHADGFDFSTYQFGEGDGEITITRASGDVSVAVDGDVATFDHAALEADMAALDDAWEAADDACADLLPEGAIAGEIFDGEMFDAELGTILDGAIGAGVHVIEIDDIGNLADLVDLDDRDLAELRAELQAQLTD